MGNVTIQQFNPVSKCWNTIHVINEDEYDSDTFVPVNKYNGPYRTLNFSPKIVLDISIKDVVEDSDEVIIPLAKETKIPIKSTKKKEPEVEEHESKESEKLFKDRWK